MLPILADTVIRIIIPSTGGFRRRRTAMRPTTPLNFIPQRNLTWRDLMGYKEVVQYLGTRCESVAVPSL